VKFQLQPTVEIEPYNPGFAFTRRVSHQTLSIPMPSICFLYQNPFKASAKRGFIRGIGVQWWMSCAKIELRVSALTILIEFDRGSEGGNMVGQLTDFPSEIHEKLGFYVYRLIDPRDGATFYIGKGRRNRVFEHVRETLKFSDGEEEEDAVSAKIKTIREIKNSGLEPIHIIQRHGLSEEEAFVVEATLIDATPGLTNIASGQGSAQFGPANASQLIDLYRSEIMDIPPGTKILAINVRLSINSTEQGRSLYDAVRCAWRISVDRAAKADLIFAVTDGVCRGVYVADRWLPATKNSFPTILGEDIPGRFGFEGHEAEAEVSKQYKGKLLPDNMQRRKGMASPILYNYD
jgi:hypothetical protein